MTSTRDTGFERARLTRDPRFDGRFFIGVKTTRIYCRPVCPVRLPRPENVVFFSTAAAASAAGYRPCLRCRPEASPGTPAWCGTSTTVNRALRLIADGALDHGGMEDLATRLGVASRHLGRLFQKHLGVSPVAVAQTRRLQFAKKLLDETKLGMTEIAYASGYGSIRRFNDHFRSVYGKTPSSLRRKLHTCDEEGFTLNLTYRPPFDYEGILLFLSKRAIPGVEEINGSRYERTFCLSGEAGRIMVSNQADRNALRVTIHTGSAMLLSAITERVRRLFDLDALPQDIDSQLQQDEALRVLVEQNPGQRLPGCWDGFEIAVRAVVGQQISVKGATTIMGRIADRWGQRTKYGLVFPEPAVLATIRADDLPMPAARANAIRELARSIVAGDLDPGPGNDTETLTGQLLAIRGIGPWTAQYIAMRALNDPDAFLHSDLVLLRVASNKLGIRNEKQLLKRAEAWRPWRAYAGMHLWRNAG